MDLLSGPHIGPLWVCSYGFVRMEPIGFLYELGMWAPYGSFIGVPIWACLFGTDMGLLWAYPYRQAIIHPILGLIRLAILSHMGHLWACTYENDRMGPIRVISYMDVPIWEIRIHPSLGPYGKVNWATHGSIIGVSICACPHWTHIGTIWDAHVGLAVWDHHTWGHIDLLSGPHNGP